MSAETDMIKGRPVTQGVVVGDAVGVSDRKWYVAVVNHNTEKSTARRLAEMDFDAYVATQLEYRLWANGRKGKVERVVIPSMVFVNCTEAERLALARQPFINRFLTDRAKGTPGRNSVATIPATQLENLRFMLGKSDSPVEFVERPYCRGERVRVVRGNLKGLTGLVSHDSDGSTRLVIELELLGGARTSIDTVDLEPTE